jgi:Ca2+-binding EF-hand superfamily protein
MTKFLICGVAAAALAGTGAAVAQTAPQAPSAQRQHMMKTEMRTDVAGHVQRMFARLDANHDGFITKAEIDAVQSLRAEKVEQRAQRFDPAKVFARIDANHDGKITPAEAEAAHNQRVVAKGGAPAQAHATAFGGLFARADANKDGVVTKAEFDAVGAQLRAHMEQAAMHRGMGDRMIDLADANKDGKVSQAEAQAFALARFDRADLNHDGQLTPQERQQAHQLMRGQRKAS